MTAETAEPPTRGLPEMTLPRAVAAAVLIAFAFSLVTRVLHLPDLLRGPDAWFYDLRTSLFSPRVETPRSDIAVILIDDDGLSDGYISRSPIDRGLQATLVKGLAAAGAKAIGLDMIYDRPTAPEADAALIAAFQATKATPVVIGALDERTKGRSERAVDFQERFIAESGRTAAHLYFARQGATLTIGDQIVRYRLGASPYPPGRKSFAEALAEAAGHAAPPVGDTPELIAWQRPPETGGYEAPFRVLRVRPHTPGAPIGDILHPGWESVVKDRIVLIGGGFDDIDRHLTPLAAIDRKLLPGVMVHAQILAQLIDGRSVPPTPFLAEIGLLILAALAGIAAGWWLGWGTGDFPVWFLGGLAVLLLGALAFADYGVIMPSGATYFAWVTGVGVGQPPRAVEVAWRWLVDRRT